MSMTRDHLPLIARGLVACALAITAVAALAQPTSAQPPRPDPVGAHEHFLVVPGAPGEVVVGPNSCQRGGSRQFDEVHHNVHAGPAPISGRACP